MSSTNSANKKTGSSAERDAKKKLRARVDSMDTDTFQRLMDLLQQDRKGKVKPLTDKQSNDALEISGFNQNPRSQNEELVSGVVERLLDNNNVSVMHKMGKKHIQHFILHLGTSDMDDLVRFMVPFFNKHLAAFMKAMSNEQRAEVFPLVLPDVMAQLQAEEKRAEFLCALYAMSDIATALDYLGSD
jgi:hypothetical protein